MATLALDLPAEDVSRAELFRDDAWQAPFGRLRAAGPLHYTVESRFGPYWSVVTHEGIRAVETRPEDFSSQAGGITLADYIDGVDVGLTMLIATDRPQHTARRRDAAAAFRPDAMAALATGIRARTVAALDALPIGETFDWVARIAIPLTTATLADLLGVPQAESHRLVPWSDWAGNIELVASPRLRRERLRHMLACRAWFAGLRAERAPDAPPDLLALMAGAEEGRDFLGNLILALVGGNDTTRNAMSGLALALDRYPAEHAKLHARPALIDTAVQEVLRWQTPLAHMRRTATRDCDLFGQRIAEGDKLALWYVSANRDTAAFGTDADAFRVDRASARKQLSFGHHIHRCLGAGVAQVQLRILLEALIERGLRVDVIEQPERTASCFVHGYRTMPVRLSRMLSSA